MTDLQLLPFDAPRHRSTRGAHVPQDGALHATTLLPIKPDLLNDVPPLVRPTDDPRTADLKPLHTRKGKVARAGTSVAAVTEPPPRRQCHPEWITTGCCWQAKDKIKKTAHRPWSTDWRHPPSIGTGPGRDADVAPSRVRAGRGDRIVVTACGTSSRFRSTSRRRAVRTDGS